MQRFIITFGKWLLPVLILCFPLDYFLSMELKKSKLIVHDEFSVWNDLYEGKINSDIVIYGSSRAWVHISSKMFEESFGKSTYNLGIDGHNFRLQQLRHQLLLEHNRKPKFIVYSLDMFTLQKKTELYNPDQFLPYLLFNNEMKSYLDTYEGYDFYDYYIPLVRYYGKRIALYSALSNVAGPLYPDSGRYKGYQGMKLEWNSDFEQASREMTSYRVQLDKTSTDLFESFMTDCQQKNIKIIFVYTPEYIKGQEFVSNRNEVMQLYKSLALKYKCPFFDYSDDEMSYDRDNFYNASHLKKQASEKFTGKLINDINKSEVMDNFVNLYRPGKQPG